MLNCGIYKLEFEDGSFYIGSSRNIRVRTKAHCSKFNEKFIAKTLLVCRTEDLLFYEQLLIDNLKPTRNVSTIAGAVCWRPETRKKLSDTKKSLGQQPDPKFIRPAGFKHTEETKIKMSLSRKGRKRDPEIFNKMWATRKAAGWRPSEEARKKMSAAHLGKSRPHTIESRAKLAAAQTGRKYSAESRAKMRASRLAHLAQQMVEA